MNKKFGSQCTFLQGEYKNKKKLGKGAFGDVFLVEDGNKELFALKVIDKKKMSGDNQDMIEYLKDEKSVMQNMNHKNLVKLFDFKDDNQYYYMLLEYCDGGDLVNLQATCKNRVFTLETATEYLSQAILGLEELHSHGYLHRDIKLQNVLVKNQGAAKVFKVADFGFAKKARNSSGTVLGTQQYMSPEIYRCGIEGSQSQDDMYGYEVDMWAFGVLFYYMLNMSFPFQINPHWTIEMKYQELTNQAKNFSYRKAVQATTRKVVVNCNDQMQDLFHKIFNTNVEKRIDFHEIRQHPVFAKHFPKASIQSQILYKNKFVSSRIKKGRNGVTNRLIQKQSQLEGKQKMGPSSICVPDQQKDYPVEKEIIRLQIEQINFLSNIVDEIEIVEGEIGCSKSYMFAYNLIKYHLILLNVYLKNLNVSSYIKKYKNLNLNWNLYFDTPEFKLKKKQIALKISKGSMRFQQLYTKCRCQLKQISALNESFKGAFQDSVDDEETFDGPFYRSYRKSTDNMYSTLKELLKTKKVKEFYFFLCAVCICHVFNQFYEDPILKKAIFSVYLSQETEKTPIFSYERLIYYLKNCGKQALVLLTRKLIQEVMMKGMKS